MAPTCFFPVLDEPVPLDWRQHCDRLRDLVIEELEAEGLNISGNSFGSRSTLGEMDLLHFALSVQSEQLSSELCFIPVSESAVLLLIQRESTLPVSEIRPWLASLFRAIPRLRDPLPEREWWAAIGPSDSSSCTQRLEAPATVGRISLTSSEVTYTEIVESTAAPSLSGGEIREFTPVVLHGTSGGQTFFEAQSNGARQINRLCAVLSVAWDGAWAVRQTPISSPLDPSGLPRTRAQSERPNLPDAGPTVEVSVPDWTESALNRLDSDPKLLEATLAHHHGLMMEERHPSYALLAYVAVIEGFGARYVDLTPCPSCPAKTGSSKRFRTALRLVCSEEEVTRLRRTYDARSKTAHEGHLHGGEDLAGAIMSMRVVAMEDWRLFRILSVMPLRRASRDLLLLGLTGTLPERDHLTDNSGHVQSLGVT